MSQEKLKALAKSLSAQNPTILDQIDEDRGAAYGEFEKVAACAQGIKEQIVMFKSNRDDVMDTCANHSEQEALDLIATKLARIACGDPEKQEDSWRDIVGYANLALKSRGHDV